VLGSQTGHCYQPFDDLLSWADARDFCKNAGGYLVTLTSQPEDAFVYSIAPFEHWLGATDGLLPIAVSAGTYAWVTGEPMTYTNWSSGEPNVSASVCPADIPSVDGYCYEHCMETLTTDAWNDNACYATKPYVCEWN
jgi:hypothetical protein